MGARRGTIYHDGLAPTKGEVLQAIRVISRRPARCPSSFPVQTATAKKCLLFPE